MRSFNGNSNAPNKARFVFIVVGTALSYLRVIQKVMKSILVTIEFKHGLLVRLAF